MKPLNWEYRKIKELGTVYSGGTPSTSIAEYWHGHIKWCTPTDITALNGYKYISYTRNTITKEGLKNSSANLLPKNSLIVCTRATIGDCAINSDEMATNQGFKSVIPHNIEIEYLYYLILYNKPLLKKLANGSTFGEVSKNDFEKIELLIPHDKHEREKIISIVSVCDKLIDFTQKLITAKERLKKGLMQQLLTGKKRLPGFNGEWKKAKIGEIVKEVKRPIEWDDDKQYDLISVRRRSGGVFYRESLFGHQILTKGLFTAKTGDFLISKMQIVHGASGIVKKEFDGMYISGSYISLHSKDDKKLDIEFFDWLSKMPEFYHLCYTSSYGVHIEKMTFDFNDFLNRYITIPSDINEQKKIVLILNTLVKEINLLKSQLELYRQQKKGLMQVLLTGAVRVKV